MLTEGKASILQHGSDVFYNPVQVLVNPNIKPLNLPQEASFIPIPPPTILNVTLMPWNLTSGAIPSPGYVRHILHSCIVNPDRNGDHSP